MLLYRLLTGRHWSESQMGNCLLAHTLSVKVLRDTERKLKDFIAVLLSPWVTTPLESRVKYQVSCIVDIYNL